MRNKLSNLETSFHYISIFQIIMLEIIMFQIATHTAENKIFLA